jgi:hypothetical protein
LAAPEGAFELLALEEWSAVELTDGAPVLEVFFVQPAAPAATVTAAATATTNQRFSLGLGFVDVTCLVW